MKKTKNPSMSVSKTITLPLDLLNQVNDEAEIAGKDFSETVRMMLQIACAVRRDGREREEQAEKLRFAKNAVHVELERLSPEEKKLLGG